MRLSLFYLLDHYPDVSGSVAQRYADAIEQSVLAEQLGYESVWLAEHHFHQLGTIPNPAVLLAAIAARTTRLRIGPAIAVLPMRPALYTAENYAMVDAISNGRLNLGIGLGNSPFELEGVGVDVDQRHALHEAALAEITDRFRSASAGEFGLPAINVPLVQQPGPPIFLPSNSPEGAYAAGRKGASLLTIAGPTTANTAEIGDRVRSHRRGLFDAGIDPDSRESVVVAFSYCAETASAAHEQAGAALARVLNLMGGTKTDPNDLYDDLRNKGTAVLGDRDQVAEVMSRFADEGIGQLAFFTAFGGLGTAMNTTSIRLLASAATTVPAV